MKWRYDTLTEALKAAAQSKQGYLFLDQKEPTFLSYAQLLTDATKIAGKLQAMGIQPSDRIIIILSTSIAFAQIWWGVQLAGAIPCVLPSSLLQKEGQQKLHAINSKLQAKLLVTIDSKAQLVNTCNTVTPTMLNEQASAVYTPIQQSSDGIALIQATSGSTSDPKCVAITHQNVLANLEQIGRRFEADEQDVVVSWLPLFHDLGLIGCFLGALYWQQQLVLLSRNQFLRRPHLWLQAISDYGGTLSPAPNFAYALTMARTKDEHLKTLDLSSWRSALCGAELIDLAVLEQFAKRFAPCGFSANALTPGYGMAEATLSASIKLAGTSLNIEIIERAALIHDQRAQLADPSTESITVVDCGPAVEGTRICIAGEDGQALGDGKVGRIWLSGPSMTEAYFNDPEKSAEIRHGEWLDTGDIGYLRNGHLFVLGRHKELIIIRGQNHYPTDFERAAIGVDGIRPGGVAAIGIYDSALASEALHLICEVDDPEAAAQTDLCQRVQGHVARRTGIPPAHIALVPRRTIPRTTSGKLQRNALKARYQASTA